MSEEFPPQTFRITRADLVHYCGASGDFNVIHWSDRLARQVGLPGVIAHGMYTMALAGRAVTAWAGAADAVEDFSVRFSRPVPVPDDDEGAEVIFTGRVKSADDEGRTTIAITATCDGETVLKMAQATIRKK
ncbi:MaoC/PaaZ C-terminal domain-containing protein [Actinoplanes sp. NPDC049265]|uniref:MaoC/PaaZ C-terminal domain-containing protein n=1 Tax=Actinoplanes sp. NPDC049265 TaxID=3363902 RepID=UPI00371E7970